MSWTALIAGKPSLYIIYVYKQYKEKRVCNLKRRLSLTHQMSKELFGKEREKIKSGERSLFQLSFLLVV